MDAVAIFALIAKGISVAQALIAAEQSAEPAFKAIYKVLAGARAGAVTDDELTQTEALLDQLIADFNLDLPPET